MRRIIHTADSVLPGTGPVRAAARRAGHRSAGAAFAV